MCYAYNCAIRLEDDIKDINKKETREAWTLLIIELRDILGASWRYPFVLFQSMT